MNGAPLPALTPELLVSDLPGSLAFYLQTLGFRLLFERPEAGFAGLRFPSSSPVRGLCLRALSRTHTSVPVLGFLV